MVYVDSNQEDKPNKKLEVEQQVLRTQTCIDLRRKALVDYSHIDSHGTSVASKAVGRRYAIAKAVGIARRDRRNQFKDPDNIEIHQRVGWPFPF